MADCLTPAQIEGLLAGALAAPEQRRAEEHAAACEACRARIEARRAEEKLFGQIREAGQDETLIGPGRPGGAAPVGSPAGTSIEGYEILREIHRGGQGVVYKAVQKATKRTVALKVLLQGPYASPKQRRRFEREIDLVASLQHPNIVTIYDSGLAGGRHYFAMEYVHGQPLDRFLLDKHLGIDDTLQLFNKICAAVNYAHQRGVIHRDLKPGNILVDADGQPHVVDFGLAKAAGSDLHDGAPMTVTGEFMGTLAYASPEQARGDPNLIDIRTDVYSLGVILYEMLTGKYPYPVVGQLADVLRQIAETAPARPSTVRRQINDEVETIVLKALAKEKERRYPSAEALGRDVERYLGGEAIEAKRDSAWYVLRKGLHRYRLSAGVAVAFVAIITFGLVVSISQRRLANDARDRAVLAELEHSRERQRADKKAAEAIAERERAEKQEALAQQEADRAKRAEAEQRSARNESEKARDAAEWEAYVANIGAATTALEHRELAAVRTRLAACPPRLRGWEWRYLDASADDSLLVLRGHECGVSCAAFSPDGARVVTASNDKTARLWDAATGRELAVLRGHEREIGSAAFSPDGALVVTASDDYTARLWDAATGRELAVLRGHEREVRSAAFSHDGDFVVTASSDNTARLWDVATASELAVLRGHERGVGTVGFSPDGARVVTGSWDGTARLWDAATGRELAVLRGHEVVVWSAEFSPDGARVLTSGDMTARLWDVATGRELAVLQNHEDQVNCAAFSPDGARVVTASHDKTARLWDAVTGRELAVLRGHDGHVVSAAFSPDGACMVTASRDNTARTWDAATGKVVAVLHGHNSQVRCAAFSPNGARVVTASYDNDARIWDAATGRKITVLRDQKNAINSAAFSPDGVRVVTASDSELTPARLWHASTGRELAVLRGHKRQVISAAFSPDGAHVATASSDNTARLWDAATGRELVVLLGHVSWVTSVAFSPDGARVLTASWDNTARIWEAATGKELAVLRGHDREVCSAAFSPDGARVVTASEDATVRLWDAATRSELAVLRGHNREVSSATFSPDGIRVLTASLDNTARIWEAATGRELAVMRGHTGPVHCAAFSPDGARVVTASPDKTVRLWDAATGRELAVLRGHEGKVRSAEFSPDGTQILTACSDQTARVWDSVPYRQRHMELDALAKAWPDAERMVDAALQAGTEPEEVARSIRANVAISETLRQAALNVLLERSSSFFNEVRERFQALQKEHVTKTRTVAAIQSDREMPARIRTKVLRLAEAWRPTASDLNELAWQSVVTPDSSPERVAGALEAAEESVRQEPNNAWIVNTLGVAQYRTGRFAEALKTLERSTKLNCGQNPLKLADLAFVAMSQFRLGLRTEATDSLARLRVLMRKHENSEYTESFGFLREAEDLIDRPTTSQAATTQPGAGGPN